MTKEEKKKKLTVTNESRHLIRKKYVGTSEESNFGHIPKPFASFQTPNWVLLGYIIAFVLP